MTITDFTVPGTQIGDIPDGTIHPIRSLCAECHGSYDPDNEPFQTWSGSLMAQAGRDPLFFAQVTTANQDIANVGYYCLRCHVPMSIVTGHATEPNGGTLDDVDRDGVSCHFCHSMLDPDYKAGVSPPEDQAILSGLADVPTEFGNAMFVLDPAGLRRGPYSDSSRPTAPRSRPSTPPVSSAEPVTTSATSRSRSSPTAPMRTTPSTTESPDTTIHTHSSRSSEPIPSGSSAPSRTAVSTWEASSAVMAAAWSARCQDCHMPRVASAKAAADGPLRSNMPCTSSPAPRPGCSKPSA